LLVIFMAGALSMGTVLADTGALTVLTQKVVGWMAPLLTGAFQAATILYWGGFLYHIFMADNAMVVTALPVLLKVAEVEGYNPLAMGLIWCFTTGGKVFVYQAASYVLGYSYGYFGAKDLLKVGAVMTMVEGLTLLILVPLYWPLIGLAWRVTPAAQAVTAAPAAQIATVSPADEVALTSDSDSDMAQAPAAPRRHTTPRSRAAVIRQAQERLTQLGFDPGPHDGRLGPQTDAALRQFQAASGLPVSGRLEQATRRALGVTLGEPTAARIRSEPSSASGMSLFTAPTANALSELPATGIPVFE
jgi:hypothetical protein